MSKHPWKKKKIKHAWQKKHRNRESELFDKDGLPKDWVMERVEAILNMSSLDEPLMNEDGTESGQTLGGVQKASQFTAEKSRAVTLLKTFGTEKQARLVELLEWGYKPEEIRQEFGLKSASAVRDMIRRLRKIKISGIPLREVLQNLNRGFSILDTSFGEAED